MAIKEKPCSHKFTLSVIPEPNQTSPETFKLSSSTMLGMDLNRARKLATYKLSEEKIFYQCLLTNDFSRLEGMAVFTDQSFHQ